MLSASRRTLRAGIFVGPGWEDFDMKAREFSLKSAFPEMNTPKKTGNDAQGLEARSSSPSAERNRAAFFLGRMVLAVAVAALALSFRPPTCHRGLIADESGMY